MAPSLCPISSHLISSHLMAVEIDADSLFFTVRTIMAIFRRELSFSDSLYLWEVSE